MILARSLQPYLGNRDCHNLCLALGLPASPGLASFPLKPKEFPGVPLSRTQGSGLIVFENELHINPMNFSPDAARISGIKLATLIDDCYLSHKDRKLESLYVHLNGEVSDLQHLIVAVQELIEQQSVNLTKLSLTLQFPPQEPSQPAIISLSKTFFPNLVKLNIGAPIHSDLTRHHIPQLRSLCLDFVSDSVLSKAAIQQYNQQQAYGSLLAAACFSIHELEIAGDIENRSRTPFLGKWCFFPHLRSLRLGWTTEDELRSLLSALRPTELTVQDCLKSVHSSLFKGMIESEQIWNEKKLPSIFSQLSQRADNEIVILPPRLPRLVDLAFSGPVYLGLTCLHLSIFGFLAKVSNESKQNLLGQATRKSVELRYGAMNTELKSLLDFRHALRNRSLFLLERDETTLLYHLYADGLVEPEHCCGSTPVIGNGEWITSSGTTKSGLSRHRKRVQSVKLLEYEHVQVSTMTRRNYRTKVSSVAVDWPTIGPEMTAKDLFLVEMWHLPLAFSRVLADTTSAADIWDNLDSESQNIWNSCLEFYLEKRMNPNSPFSFNNVKPWWYSIPPTQTR